jgi:pimeloyl-ACP methyl ester carboxylesterase
VPKKASTLALPNGGTLRYHKLNGAQPGIVFLSGFRSDMEGVKALALEQFCKERGLQYIRFDYRGHGISSGSFDDYRIGTGKEDILAVLDDLCESPQILIGSSMGGWLMLLAAMARPEKVAALIGLAAAPDFTEHLLLDTMSEAEKRELQQKGVVMVPNCWGGEPYPIYYDFIAESGDHLVLDGEIPIHMKDEDVPWQFSMTLNEKLASQQVKTTLIDDGDHRLSSEKSLRIILKVVDKMLVTLREQKADADTL